MVTRAPALPEQGSILAGRYVVGRPLGKGAMGVVYEAELKRLEQRVAIKVLRPEILAEPSLVARFDREARLLAKLKSDHVVRVIDVDTTDDGLPFLVMERLEGTDLASMLRAEGPFAIHRAVDLVRQICSGMADAHRASVIHRDLKPSNVFVIQREGASDGIQEIVKIVDFGVSKLVGDTQLTATESTLGTPRYMSPEQIRSAKSADERSDVWSIGIILFELLAGKPPFYGESATGVAASIMVDEPLSLRAMRADVPEWLERVIVGTLVKNPAERIPTMTALRAALDPFSSRSSLSGASSTFQAPPMLPLAVALPVAVPLAPPPASGGRGPASSPSHVLPHPAELPRAPSFSLPPGPTEASWAQAPKSSLTPVANHTNLLLFVALFVLATTGLTATLIIVRHSPHPRNEGADASQVNAHATASRASTPIESATHGPTALDAPSPTLSLSPSAPLETASAASPSSLPKAISQSPTSMPSALASPAGSQKQISPKVPTKDCPTSDKILVGSKLICP